MKNNPTHQDSYKAVKAMVLAAGELYKCIPEGDFPSGGIPNGHLYAIVMGQMDLEFYQALIKILVDAKLVKLSNHYLTRLPLPPAPAKKEDVENPSALERCQTVFVAKDGHRSLCRFKSGHKCVCAA